MNNKAQISLAAIAAAMAWGVATPASAQVTWNYSSTCYPTSGQSSSCTASAGNTMVSSAWTASSGSHYVAGNLTNQGSSGIGLTSPGESSASPNHAIDNNGNHELVLLNFGTNLVTLTGITTGWSNTDTDISILRWTGGSNGPTMTSTASMFSSGQVAAGWTLVKSGDLDLGQTANKYGDFGGGSLSTGLSVNAANSSSWWIVSSYFGGAATNLDKGNDYFKLLSVTAKCVSNTAGGACGTTPPGHNTPEPGSLGLAAAALFGLAYTRRRAARRR